MSSMTSTNVTVAEPLWSFNCAITELEEYANTGRYSYIDFNNCSSGPKLSRISEVAQQFEIMVKNLVERIEKNHDDNAAPSCDLEVANSDLGVTQMEDYDYHKPLLAEVENSDALYKKILTKLFAKALNIKLTFSDKKSDSSVTQLHFTWEKGTDFETIGKQFAECEEARGNETARTRLASWRHGTYLCRMSKA